MRHAFIRLHRWLGLSTAAFLAIAGLTGSIIAFNHELDEWLNPELFHSTTPGTPKPPLEIAAALEAAEPRLRVSYVPLEREPGHSLQFGVVGRIDPATGAPYEIGYTEVWVDPVTGARLGEREWGACCLSRKQALPFIYSVHYTLHMPELWGVWLMGAIALVWAVDCFVGFYVTLPPPADTRRATFWQRWKPAWRVKVGASRYRLNFDLHRAGGLWLWALLLMMAVTAASFNFHFEFFRPALSLVTAVTPSPFDPANATPWTEQVEPGVSYAAVVASAREEAVRRGWQAPFDVFYSPDFGLYGVGFGDHHESAIGVPYAYFDARDGRPRGETVPGQGSVGDVILQSMYPLHSGQIIGLPGRILICVAGLVVTMLSITGVIIWEKKRRGRRALASRAAAADVRTRVPLPFEGRVEDQEPQGSGIASA